MRYRYLDGTEAAAEYRASIKVGDSYSVTSPVIPGFSASTAVVAGIMPNRSVEYTVLYVPDGSGETTPAPGMPTNPPRRSSELLTLEDYNAPLGLDGVFADAGDCFE